ncbi:MAG: hypothetical protein U5Q03_14420 [Bacteroidota bacterium]|nr:hypothetical protein [Bacteroidota bacterium]
MKTRQIILLFLLSLIFAHIANLGGFFLNWHWQLSIAGLMYFIVPYFYFRKEKSTKWRFLKALIILLGLYLQFIAAWIIEGKPAYPQVIPIQLTPLLAVALALWMVAIHQKAKQLTLAVVVAGFFIFAGLIGMPNWLNYVYSPKATTQRDFPPVTFVTHNKTTLNESIAANEM